MCAKTIGMDVQVSRVKTMIPPVFVALPASATVLLPVWSYIAKLHNFKSKALKSFVRESAMLPWPPYQRWQPRYIYVVPICSSRSQFYYNFLMRSQSSAFGKAAQQGYHCQRGRQWRWSKSTNILTKEVRFPIEHGIFEYIFGTSFSSSTSASMPLCFHTPFWAQGWLDHHSPQSSCRKLLRPAQHGFCRLLRHRGCWRSPTPRQGTRQKLHRRKQCSCGSKHKPGCLSVADSFFWTVDTLR